MEPTEAEALEDWHLGRTRRPVKDIRDLDEELCRIQDDEIRSLTKECLEKAPPHFWYRPASSSGKYHAPEENESGGLIVHTKRVCKVAEILIEAWPNPIKPDVIRSACALHDIRKYGDGFSPTQHTLSNHPQLGAELVREVAGNKYDGDKVYNIMSAIASHMGKWGGKAIFSHEDLIVHLADVIATKVWMEV